MTSRALTLCFALTAVAPVAWSGEVWAGHRGSHHYRGGGHGYGHGHRYDHGYGHGHGHGHHYGHSDGWVFGLGVALGAVAVGVLAPEPVVAYGPGYGYGYYGGYAPVAVYGSIDTEVRPRAAAVYIDGVPVGTAGDFDGWPSHLHAAPGSHTMEFRAPGYHSARLSVDVIPGRTVQVRHDLTPGGGTQAFRIVPATSDSSVPVRQDAGTDAVRDEERGTGSEDVEPFTRPRDPVPAGAQASGDARDGAMLRLHVDPADASVYVDGRLFGAGADDARYAIALSAGGHRIEVVKPGYDLFSGTLQLSRGQTQELDVRLLARDR